MYQKALVALDGSTPSFKAVLCAQGLALKDCIREISLIYVINIPHTPALPCEQGLDIVPTKYYQDLIGEAQQLLDRAKAMLGTEINVKTIVEEGPTAETILKLAERENYDLIIVGSRGLNPSQRLLLGSISNKIVSLALCPVLVIK